MAAGVLILAAVCPARAYLGHVFGSPIPGHEFGACDEWSVQGHTGSLTMSHELFPDDILWILGGRQGLVLMGCMHPQSGWGFYDCPGLNFAPPPTTAAESVWVLMGVYPQVHPFANPLTAHPGWLLLDSTDGLTRQLGDNVTQALWPLSAEIEQESSAYHLPSSRPPWSNRVVIFPPPPAQPTPTPTGITYRFRAVVEFGRDWAGRTAACRIGGDPEGTGFDDRPLLGYNIYRLMNVPPEVSTPDHYLHGPDLTPGTGDEGWVAFYPSGTGAGGAGLDLSDPAGPNADNDPDDCFGIEGRDWDGDTDIDHEDDAILIYYDWPGLAPNAPTPQELASGTFTYVFQPVLKGTPQDDADGDTIPDQDLDRDTVPEFISPGGVGLGLAADLEERRTILISTEVVAVPGIPIIRPPGQFPIP